MFGGLELEEGKLVPEALANTTSSSQTIIGIAVAAVENVICAPLAVVSYLFIVL